MVVQRNDGSGCYHTRTPPAISLARIQATFHHERGMTATWYCRGATWGRTWRSAVLAAVLCGVLGAVSLAALAGARRTDSAYGRYLHSINASDVLVNVPSADTSLDARVASLPGIRSSAAWLGMNANPVVHGKVDDDFQTNGFAGSVKSELFTQDAMTVLAGRLPPSNRCTK